MIRQAHLIRTGVAAKTVAVVVVVAVAGWSPAFAQETSTSLSAGQAETKPVRWHGSTLMFDQSATTQTVGLGADYQSTNPTYEWWVAARPRYFLYETKTDAVSLNLWANLYLELTNSDTTTRRREALIGPTYLWVTYGHTFDRGGYKTAVSVGPRVTIPTDKAARGSGQIIGAGAIAGVSQSFPLLGKSARALNGARLGVSVIFNHPLSRATTGVNNDIRLLRQDVEARLIPSDQLTGSLGVENSLNLAFSGQLQLLPRLDLSLSYVLLNAWGYAPREGECVATMTGGCTTPISIADPQTYKVNTWATASLNYKILDDLAVSLGYYNLARQIGEDGTRRNPLWSPSARLFFSLTGTLDVTYGRFTGTRRAID